jgi:CrcB protein
MLWSVLLVGLGGAAGSIFRYLISIYINKWFPTAFPVATFTANIVGCLIIGILFGLFAKGQLSHPDYKFLLVTGFCGGFTTFSTFSSETLLLFQSGNAGIALTYIAFSIVLGLGAVWLGMILIKGGL